MTNNIGNFPRATGKNDLSLLKKKRNRTLFSLRWRTHLKQASA